MYTSSQRLVKGHKTEYAFLDYINSKTLWNAHMYGQRSLDNALQNDLRRIEIPSNSDYAKQKIDLLPEDWRHVYKRGIGNNFPALCRWDADALCVYNKKPQFFAEVKSTKPDKDAAFVEVSCYLAALVNDRLGLPLHFVFHLNQPNLEWAYLTLDDIPNATSRIHDGRGVSGSGTPFLIIKKDQLTKSVDSLLTSCEWSWFL